MAPPEISPEVRAMWDEWKRMGVKPRLSIISLQAIYDRLVKTAAPDPGALLDHVDPSLGFDENISSMERVLGVSLPEPVEYRPIELLRDEMDKLHALAEQLGVDVEVIEARRLSSLLRASEDRERLKREVEGLKREIEEAKKPPPPLIPPPPPPPPPLLPPVLPEEWLYDKFSSILRSHDLDPLKYRSRFEEEYPGIEGLRREDQQRTIDLLAREIIREAIPPPKPPPRPPPIPPIAPPPVRVRMEEIREPELVSRICIVGGEAFTIDLDLVRRVTETGVVMRPRGVTSFQGPLLDFPERFYHMCPDHRYEKFSYYDIYHALAYTIWEARRSGYKRLFLTLDGLKAMGFNPDDIRAIEEWLAEMPKHRTYS